MGGRVKPGHDEFVVSTTMWPVTGGYDGAGGYDA
jgi:hypothetical protein